MTRYSNYGTITFSEAWKHVPRSLPYWQPSVHHPQKENTITNKFVNPLPISKNTMILEANELDDNQNFIHNKKIYKALEWWGNADSIPVLKIGFIDEQQCIHLYTTQTQIMFNGYCSVTLLKSN